MSLMATPVQLELPIPKDRFGNRATKLVVVFSSWEPRLTIEDDLDTFTGIPEGRYVELTVRGFVKGAPELPTWTEDGQRETEMKKIIAVTSVEIA